MPANQPRLLILAAHPDDAEYYAGGLATLYRRLGREVKIVSLTDGRVGHNVRSGEELIAMRRLEAANAGNVIDCEYVTLDFPDGQLQPTIEARYRIIKEIREFQPDLVISHRTCDYHPDHRAVGQIVQDASYLVTVPRVLPDVRPLRKPPVFAYMTDTFTRPTRLLADEILDVTDCVDQIVGMLACHVTQVFEWLAYEEGILDTVPQDKSEWMAWARAWYVKHMQLRLDHFHSELLQEFGDRLNEEVKFVEVFEIGEYGTVPDRLRRRELFPRAGADISRRSTQVHDSQSHTPMAGRHGSVATKGLNGKDQNSNGFAKPRRESADS